MKTSTLAAILEWKKQRDKLGSVRQLAHRLGVSADTVYQTISRVRKAARAPKRR